jgi:hypothetical protein
MASVVCRFFDKVEEDPSQSDRPIEPEQHVRRSPTTFLAQAGRIERVSGPDD